MFAPKHYYLENIDFNVDIRWGFKLDAATSYCASGMERDKTNFS